MILQRLGLFTRLFERPVLAKMSQNVSQNKNQQAYGRKHKHNNSNNKSGKNDRKYNQAVSPNSSNFVWPSSNHKSVLFCHKDEVSIDFIKTLVRKYGTVEKTKKIFTPEWIISIIQMSTASEAESLCRELSHSIPEGISRVMPDRKNESIQSYESYWDDESIQQGLQDGTLMQGVLRINPKMFMQSYVNDGKNPDILFDSVIARNRALNGDVVALKLRPESGWQRKNSTEKPNNDPADALTNLKLSDSSVDIPNIQRPIRHKTADVVGLVKAVHNRKCVGIISKPYRAFTCFVPVDNCFPRLLIPNEQCPKEFFTNVSSFKDKLFLAEIVQWQESEMLPLGKLSKFIGNSNEIEPETTRILLENDLDDSDFSDTINDSLPQQLPWKIPAEEIVKRRDLRSECIFTIDPSTARDLDDALHCKKIDVDLYEIGVHIADVSYFVKSHTEVDAVASKRCTSVYLVQRVIPMLPRMLCEDLCSLNPAEDRLTFSVIWKMTGDGRIVDEWFGRSVIHSCAKLSYDHAQSFIDFPEKTEINKEQYPLIAGYNIEVIKEKVLDLFAISQKLKQRRTENGALRLDQIKLSFTLDEDTGMPNACYAYEYKQSNQLIEEYMLLANMAVAHKLIKTDPEHAFLRAHPEPKEDMLKSMAKYCEENGWKLDASSAKALASSLRKFAGDDELSKYRMMGLQLLAIKPQELAIYFCAGCENDEENYRHYALNVPLYTHFTSPIRRYADVIVHRQLAAALGDDHDVVMANLTPEGLQRQADMCNSRKSASKRVQEMSNQLFFCALLRSVGCLETPAVVMYIYDRSFDILSVHYGQMHRVYLDSLPIVGYKEKKENARLELLWPCDSTDNYRLTAKQQNLSKEGKLEMPKYSKCFTQTIKVFSVVDAVLELGSTPLQVRAFIRRKRDTKTDDAMNSLKMNSLES